MKKIVVLMSLVLLTSLAWADSQARNANQDERVHAGDYNRVVYTPHVYGPDVTGN